MPVIVDSNVLIDLYTDNQTWSDWSRSTVRRTAASDILVINPIIYAEVSVAFQSIEEVEDAISPDDFDRHQLPYEAAYLAGKAFVDYRRRGGVRTSPLPDFYIGAHAAVARFDLLTRDAARYRTYFPTVRLIAPD
jgi:predicted nucleic acid-binding protein